MATLCGRSLRSKQTRIKECAEERGLLKLQFKNSYIGHGVFAEEKKNDLVCQYKGELLQKEEWSQGLGKQEGTFMFFFQFKENPLCSLESENSFNVKVTHSSGNHGLAVAMAAKLTGLNCAVVTPKTTPGYKLDSIKRLGAELVLCEQTMESRIKTCNEFQEKHGYHYISSCDDYDVITGQATLGLEFLSQVPELDAILVSVSGGGMAAGSCLAVKYIKPECKVYTAEPPGKYLGKCLRTEKRLWPNPPQYLDTVAEGLRIQQIGHRNWPILLDNLQKDVFTVEDEDTVRGLQYAFKYLKVVLEPSAGTAVAAALSDKMRNMPNLKNVGVVLCGGNVDIQKLPEFLQGVQEISLP